MYSIHSLDSYLLFFHFYFLYLSIISPSSLLLPPSSICALAQQRLIVFLAYPQFPIHQAHQFHSCTEAQLVV